MGRIEAARDADDGPGVADRLEALREPRYLDVERFVAVLCEPRGVIGKSTVDAIRSGSLVASSVLCGVAGIINMIEVKPAASATDVRAKIEAALKRNAEVEADAIKVTVKDAKVTLDGKVHAWHERNLVENAAWSAPGVRSVVDHLTLA